MNLIDAIGSFGFSILRLSTPIIFAALACTVTKKAGLLNMSVEGMMLTAALAGVLVSAVTQSVILGILGAVAAGCAVGLIVSTANLVGKSELYLTCIAMNLIATGGTTFALYMITGTKGTTFSYLPSLAVPNIDIPLIKDIPLLGRIVSGHSVLTYLAFLTALLTWVLIFKTRLGLRLRSVGENANAAQSVGVSVTRIQTYAYIIAGAIGGLGGAFMSMSYVSWFSREMVAGRGFIGLSANNIANGNPFIALLFSIIFGSADATSNVLQLTDAGMAYFIKMLPYVITIVSMVIMSLLEINRRKKMKQQVVAKAIAELHLEGKDH